jgi:hypothetical protein
MGGKPPMSGLVVHVVRPGQRYEHVDVDKERQGSSSGARSTVSEVSGGASGEIRNIAGAIARGWAPA